MRYPVLEDKMKIRIFVGLGLLALCALAGVGIHFTPDTDMDGLCCAWFISSLVFSGTLMFWGTYALDFFQGRRVRVTQDGN